MIDLSVHHDVVVPGYAALSRDIHVMVTAT
jgi:hypothetical protein